MNVLGFAPARRSAGLKKPSGMTVHAARRSRFALSYSPSAPKQWKRAHAFGHSANGLASFIGISPAPSRGPQPGT